MVTQENLLNFHTLLYTLFFALRLPLGSLFYLYLDKPFKIKIMDKTINEFYPGLFLWVVFVAVFGIAIFYAVYKLYKRYTATK